MKLHSALLPYSQVLRVCTLHVGQKGALYIIMTVLSAVRLLHQTKQILDELLNTDWLSLINAMQEDSTFKVQNTRC